MIDISLINGKAIEELLNNIVEPVVGDTPVSVQLVRALKNATSQEDISALSSELKALCKELEQIAQLVGDTAVHDQINDALDEVTADDFGIYVQNAEPQNAVAGDIWVDTANDPAFIMPSLPEVTSADNGKVLMVVNGSWQAVNLNLSIDANGVVFM